MNQEDSYQALSRCMQTMKQFLQRDKDLLQELAPARKIFSRGQSSVDRNEQRLADSRFWEWFVFERISDRYHEPPILTFYEAMQQSMEGQVKLFAEKILDTVYGVFEVIMADINHFCVRNLANGREFQLHKFAAAKNALVGDIIVGRLFASADNDYILSQDSATAFRDSTLLAALQQDFARARTNREAKQVSQLEMERLFFQPKAKVSWMPLEELEHRWENLVAASGKNFKFQTIRTKLENSATPSDVVTSILDELALASEVDLEMARSLLLNFLAYLRTNERQHPFHKANPEALCPCGSKKSYADCCLIKDSVNAYESGKQHGENVQTLLQELSAAIGLESELEKEEEAETTTPTAAEISPLMQEFFWEKGQPSGGEVLLAFAKFVEEKLDPPLVRILDLDSSSFLRFLLLELPLLPVNNYTGAQAFQAIRIFCEWADKEQGTHLLADFSKLEEIMPDVARVIAINSQLRAKSNPNLNGQCYRVVAANPREGIILRNLFTETIGQPIVGHADSLDAQILAAIQSGDVVKGSYDSKSSKVLIHGILPAQAEAFLI